MNGVILGVKNELTESEWHTPQSDLNTFSPAAALPEAFFFLAPILLEI